MRTTSGLCLKAGKHLNTESGDISTYIVFITSQINIVNTENCLITWLDDQLFTDAYAMCNTVKSAIDVLRKEILQFSRMAARFMSVDRESHRRAAAEMKARSRTRRRVSGTNVIIRIIVAKRRLVWRFAAAWRKCRLCWCSTTVQWLIR